MISVLSINTAPSLMDIMRRDVLVMWCPHTVWGHSAASPNLRSPSGPSRVRGARPLAPLPLSRSPGCGESFLGASSFWERRGAAGPARGRRGAAVELERRVRSYGTVGATSTTPQIALIR